MRRLTYFRVSLLFITIIVYNCKKDNSDTPLPITVISQAATNISLHGATLNGIVNANDYSTTVSFEYGMSTDYGKIISAVQSPVQGNTPVTVNAILENLTPNTIYHYRIKTTNANGIVFSKDTSFSTLNEQLITLEATNISISKATLNGSVNPMGMNTIVSFEYGTTTNYSNTIVATQGFISGNSNISISTNISGLTGNTTYHYRVKTESIAGISYGEDIAFTTQPTVVDGMYILGTSTSFSDYDSKCRMTNAINEFGGNPRLGMYEIYMTLTASNKGFNIVEVSNNTETTLGPLDISTKVINRTNDQIDATIQLGSFSNNSNKFTVPNDGLYHIVLDKKRNIIAIVPINHWAIIGSATPNGWGSETVLPKKGLFNKTNMEYEQTNIRIDRGEFKFRYDNGWRVELSGDSVKIKTSLGGSSIDALSPEGASINITAPQRGFYTINLKWSISEGFKATMTKTGDISFIDYSNYKLGLIGNSYLKANGSQANWDENWGATLTNPLAYTTTPVVTNTTTYTWTWDHVVLTPPLSDNMKLTIRQNDNWSGKIIGYYNANITGAAASNFTGDGGNFICNVSGDYKFVLVIKADTEEYTLTATKY